MAGIRDPDFCLLIPCYNNQEGLLRSLRSVSYDPGKFLIVVVDDGSTKPLTPERLKRDGLDEAGFILLTNTGNLGITRSLNRGLKWIIENTDSRYVARLDCGDVCDPGRFRIQVSRMDADPALTLIGSWCRFRDPVNAKTYSYRTPLTAPAIRRAMHTRNVFIHPTVMFRVAALQKTGLYPEGFEFAEDYAFFWKLILSGDTTIIDQFLVECEVNRQGISMKNKGKQLAARARVIRIFGSKALLKVTGFLRLGLLFLLPKELALWLKQAKD